MLRREKEGEGTLLIWNRRLYLLVTAYLLRKKMPALTVIKERDDCSEISETVLPPGWRGGGNLPSVGTMSSGEE